MRQASDRRPMKKKKKKAPTINLSTAWDEWHTLELRLRSSDATRQQVSNTRNTVGFMELFLGNGLQLFERGADFKKAATASGVSAEAAVVNFLVGRCISGHGAESVLKHMRDARR